MKMENDQTEQDILEDMLQVNILRNQSCQTKEKTCYQVKTQTETDLRNVSCQTDPVEMFKND